MSYIPAIASPVERWECQSVSHHVTPFELREDVSSFVTAPLRLESIEIVTASPLARGRSVFIFSPCCSGATATVGAVVMRLGGLRPVSGGITAGHR